MIVITRSHEFSYGHRVAGHESKCAYLHGHNAKVDFTVEAAELDTIGRVIDFSIIKTTLCEWLETHWDHRMLLWTRDPLALAVRDIDPNVVILPINPTAENLAIYLVESVAPALLDGTDVRLVACTFHETSKCSATYALSSAKTSWSV